MSKYHFMKGKALAAAMALDVGTRGADCRRDLVADYRCSGDVSPQENFTRKYLEVLLADPDLLDGFSAALTQLLEEGFDCTGVIPHCVAAASYDACHSYIGDDGNRYTAPRLQAQLREFSLSNLAYHVAEVTHG